MSTVEFPRDPFYGKRPHPSLANVADYLLAPSDEPTRAAFAAFTRHLVDAVPYDNPMFTVALRKLLECRDAVERCTP